MALTNKYKQGFEGLIYYGAAGTTAATQILNARDIKLSKDPQMGDTTVRGDGTSRPVETEGVSTIKWSASLNMVNNTDDAIVAALKTAAATGEPVAIRMKDYTAGKGYDGDCNVKEEKGMPLRGEQTVDFTFTPNRELRAPQIYV